MNFDEYEKWYFPLYAEFAETMRFIVEHAMPAVTGLPMLQSIQARAKAPDRLKSRLKEERTNVPELTMIRNRSSRAILLTIECTLLNAFGVGDALQFPNPDLDPPNRARLPQRGKCLQNRRDNIQPLV